MQRYTVTQRTNILKIYFQSQRSIAATRRKLRATLGPNAVPDMKTIRSLVRKFEENGLVGDKPRSGRPRSGRSAENVARTSDSVTESPKTSIRHRSQQLELSRATTQRILRKDLHLTAYKVQQTQELKPADHPRRLQYANWLLNAIEENDDFWRKIIMSDEAHFHLGGYVNRQNCRQWSTENPRVIHEQPMHPLKVTVWCGFWAGGVIGPFFFENDAEQTVTVTGERYREMLNNFLAPKIAENGLEDMWFQQDGATPHTSRETMVLLRAMFPNRLISKSGHVDWPPRSCDLTPLDSFLWGYLKSKVYTDDPQTLEHLKDNIRAAILDIEPGLCEDVMQNAVRRAEVCQRERGGHLADILFHT